MRNKHRDKGNDEKKKMKTKKKGKNEKKKLKNEKRGKNKIRLNFKQNDKIYL